MKQNWTKDKHSPPQKEGLVLLLCLMKEYSYPDHVKAQGLLQSVIPQSLAWAVALLYTQLLWAQWWASCHLAQALIFEASFSNWKEEFAYVLNWKSSSLGCIPVSQVLRKNGEFKSCVPLASYQKDVWPGADFTESQNSLSWKRSLRLLSSTLDRSPCN